MFSGNDKISGRQAFRLLTFDLLGLSTLLIPTVLAGVSGRDGVFCIVIGIFAGLLFLRLLKVAMVDMVQESFSDYLTRNLGTFGGRLVQAGYLIYLVLLAGYTAYLFTALVLNNLLRQESFTLVLITILILTGYGLLSGIEGRARVYELLFWFLLIPLFLMLFSALDEIDTDYWTPVFHAGAGGILAGSYYVFICISLIFLLLFLGGYAEKKEGIFRAGKAAILFVGMIHIVLYLVLLGIFGANALAKMDYPAVTLMSTVRTSGGFFKRADAFMFGIWFFTLYALLNSAVFYSGTMFRGLMGKKKCCWGNFAILVVVLLEAFLFYQAKEAGDYYQLFLEYVGTPFVVIVPLVLAVTGKKSQEKKQKTKKETKNYQTYKKLSVRKWKNAGLMAVVIFSAAFLSGCNTPELEDRNFPIEVAVTDTEHFSEKWLDASEAGNRVIDYSHLKVMILNQDFVENEKSMTEFLELLEKQNEVPRNTYVAVAEDAEKIMEIADVEGQSVGTYLEELFENVSEIDKKAYPTLGTLYQEKENRLETLFLPYLTEEEEKPVVDGYYVWKRGKAAGRVGSETALLSAFTGNDMNEYTLSLEREFEVELFDSHNEIRFSGTPEQRMVEVDVYCKGRVAAESPGKFYSERELEKLSQEYMNRVAEEALKADNPVDVANSYKKIGGYRRDWYELLCGTPDNYEEGMDVVYNVEIVWVNL